MSLFNFIGTFFFVSLGITFVLITLLIYHFKQRLTSLEQKEDTMFEIVNNVVKEMKSMKNRQTLESYPPFVHSTTTAIPNGVYYPPFSPPLFKTSLNTVREEEEEPLSVTEDNEDDISEVEEDLSEGDEEEEDLSEEEDNRYGEEDFENEEKEEESTPPSFDPIDVSPSPIENIHVCKLDIDPHSELQEINIHDGSPVIHVNKLDEPALPTTPTPVVSEKKEDRYRKMNIHQLKTLVLTKGLATDISKMKKNELVKLLEESE